jgi:hypothetical protein
MPTLTAGHFISDENENDCGVETKLDYSICFSNPDIVDEADEITSIEIDEATAHQINSDGHILPCETRVFTFPLGTEIQSVICHHSEPRSIPVEKPIAQIDVSHNPHLSSFGFPQDSDQWFEWRTGGGINDGDHVLFLIITMYPVQYQPEENSVLFVDRFDISVQVDRRTSIDKNNSEYDMLIISPSSFQESLNPLINHKKSCGFNVLSLTLEDIYNDIYFSVDGFDEAEEIKRFLYEAWTDWGIEFVLLVGNINTFPMRKTWMGSGNHETSVLTDLYYADLCFGNGSFCSWDSNNNGIYGESRHGSNNDLVDLYPDIKVGRLACTTTREVRYVIEKIISYEKNAFGSEWANTMISG